MSTAAVRVTTAAEGLPHRRFTIAEVEAMVAAGVMDEDERVELVGGELVPVRALTRQGNGVKTWIQKRRHMDMNDRIVVTRGGCEHTGTSQSGGLALVTGVGPQHTPATKLWFGKASNKPGFRSLPHHHGEAETGAYVLSGRARIYFGEDYREFVDLSEGDFMFVPPFLPHLEANMSTTEELWWIACRSPENIVVNLADVADASLPGYRRT
jgi:uncharacterized RmlC-like cupin family protein